MKHKTKLILCILFLSLVGFSVSASVLIGEGKTCKFVEEGKYQPFSDINSKFPVIGKLIEGKCIPVSRKVDDMVATAFQVFLGIVSLVAVVQVSVAGIQWMTQDAGGDKSAAKKRLTGAIIGLVLALSSWLILSTVNPSILNTSIDFTTSPLSSLIQKGIDQANIAPLPGGPTTALGVSSAGSVAVGTQDSNGAIRPTSNPTVFGFRDGDGSVGASGDNGLGNGLWSPESGWTYYNGGAHNPSGDPSKYSQGVALPYATLVKDFGSPSEVKYGAYEIFKNGVSVGAFPVVDNSATKLDLSYGLVKNHFDPNLTSSKGWDGAGANITYKPLPGYWKTHERPAQPMVKDDFAAASPNASAVDTQVQTPGNFGFK